MNNELLLTCYQKTCRNCQNYDNCNNCTCDDYDIDIALMWYWISQSSCWRPRRIYRYKWL